MKLSYLMLPVLLILFTGGQSLAQNNPIILKTCNQVSADSPSNRSLIEMGRILEAKSGGTMKIELFPNGQLGTNRELLEQTQSGLLELIAPSLAPLSGFNQAGEFLDLPYLFKDDAAAEKALDSEVGEEILKKMEESNFIGLAWWTQGWRHLTTTNREVHKPEDVKGLKIRVMENPLHIAHFKALGASPIPMAYTELLTALQQGVVDAQENPYANIKLSGFYEVQKYIIETAHVYDPVPIIVSKPFWEGLTSQQQQWLRESAIEGRQYSRDLVRQGDAEIKEELKKEGRNIIIELTPEQKTLFLAAVEPVYKEWAPKYNGLVERIQKLQN